MTAKLPSSTSSSSALSHSEGIPATGLNKELELPPRNSRVSKRRAEDELVSPLQKAPRTSHTTTHKKQHADKNRDPIANTMTAKLPSSTSSSSTLSHSSRLNDLEVKARLWPYDFYVCEIRDGLLNMAKLLGSAFSRRRRKSNRFNKKDAFLKAFPGVKYVKTTVWKYKKLWDDSDEGIRDLFTDLGKAENAYFEHFLAALDNPHLLPSTLDNTDSQSSDSDSSHEDEHNISLPTGTHTTPSDHQDDSERTGTHIIPSDHQSPDKGKSREEPEVLEPLSHCSWPPVNIDFNNLRYRVRELQEHLEEILFEPVESDIFRSLVISFEAGSSGAQSTGIGNGGCAG